MIYVKENNKIDEPKIVNESEIFVGEKCNCVALAWETLILFSIYLKFELRVLYYYLTTILFVTIKWSCTFPEMPTVHKHQMWVMWISWAASTGHEVQCIQSQSLCYLLFTFLQHIKRQDKLTCIKGKNK